VAPILVLALVAMVDVGLAVYQRMMLDHALRAGAQTAMADPGTAEVLKMMQVTAEKNFPSADGKPSAVSFDPPPVRYCACPEAADVSPTAAPACSTTCANANPTFMYYRINARTAYKGMLIPTIPLSSSMRVQIR
jgi:pilus assembly protein CpaE